MLQILTLARAGISDEFIFPRFKENFSSDYNKIMLLFEFDIFFQDSLLHELGVLDAGRISGEITKIINGGRSCVADVSFYNAVKLEALLRSCLINSRVTLDV